HKTRPAYATSYKVFWKKYKHRTGFFDYLCTMKFFRSILSVVLAALVLFTATSFSVGLHFCSGDLQNVALFSKAPTCEKEQSVPPCHQEKHEPCCEDTYVQHDAEQTLQTPVVQQEAAPFVLADYTFSPIVVAEVIPSFDTVVDVYIDSGPLLPPSDLTVFHQVFLI